MTTAVSNLIRTQVDFLNVRAVEAECQAELCRAHAFGDSSDVEALRGKIALCKRVREEESWDVGICLADLVEAFGLN